MAAERPAPAVRNKNLDVRPERSIARMAFRLDCGQEFSLIAFAIAPLIASDAPPQWVGCKMSVTFSGIGIRMPKQLTNDGKPES